MSAQELDAAERREAVRALLRRPLLTADAEAPLALVRRHASWLREFFEECFGWTLHVERELVRLGKTPGDTSSGGRGAVTSEGAPFGRRRYVVLCLALGVLEHMDRQITLHKVAEGIVGLSASDPALAASGFAFTLTAREERRELVSVVRALLSLGALRRVQGDEEDFVSSSGDALYRIDRAVLARLINARRPPSTLAAPGNGERDGERDRERDRERVRSLVEEPHVDTEDARRLVLRHRLARRLVDDPVVYYSDLDEDEREYFHRARSAILKPILEATGLVAEARAEGIALVDPERELTDFTFPQEGTGGHVALLVAELLATRARAGDRCVPVEWIERHVRELVIVHGKHWRKAAREPGAEAELASEALDFLVALDLARHVSGGVEPRPAVARFALLPPRSDQP